MRTRWFATGLVFTKLMCAIPAGAQTEASPDQRITIREVEDLRVKTETNGTLDDQLKANILALCDVAITSLKTAAENRRATNSSGRDRRDIDHQARALRQQLARPEIEPSLDLPDNVFHAENALARERSRLAANRAALQEQEQLAEERAQSRNEISHRLGALDQEIELIKDELWAQGSSDANPDFRLATRMSILARQEAARSETERLRAALLLLEDRSILFPLRTELAQRRVAGSEALVAVIEERAHDLRASAAEESLNRVRVLCEKVAEQTPELAALAAETENYAEYLWDSEGIVPRAENTAKALSTTRKHQAELRRIAELTRRKFEAFGHRGSITRWWPDVPPDFPEIVTVSATVERLDGEIPEVEHLLITIEQKRSQAFETGLLAKKQLETARGKDLDPELLKDASSLLTIRRDLLDDLTQLLGRYSNQLVEHRALSQHFLINLQEIERFLYSQVLWARSVPKPIVPRFGDMVSAAKWLTTTENPKSAAVTLLTGGQKIRKRGILASLLLILALFTRQRVQNRLAVLAARVSNPKQDRFRYTLEALLLTVVRAAPLPLVLYLGSLILLRGGESTFFFSGGTALNYVAFVAILLETMRQLYAPNGLTEAHFAWPTRITRKLYRGLLWPEVVGLPVIRITRFFKLGGLEWPVGLIG